MVDQLDIRKVTPLLSSLNQSSRTSWESCIFTHYLRSRILFCSHQATSLLVTETAHIVTFWISWMVQ